MRGQEKKEGKVKERKRIHETERKGRRSQKTEEDGNKRGDWRGRQRKGRWRRRGQEKDVKEEKTEGRGRITAAECRLLLF